MTIVTLFWCHIVKRAHHLAGRRDLYWLSHVGRQSGQSKIQHLDDSVRREHQVRRFDISMHKVLTVSRVQP